MKTTQLLPYIVPPSYVEGSEISPVGLVRHLGHDVYSMLVWDLDGLCRGVLSDELSISPFEAYSLAMTNLEGLLQRKDIEIRAIKGPDGSAIIVAEGHWASAACILLPKLHKMVLSYFKVDAAWAMVPSRSSLVVFSRIDSGYINELKEMVRKAESFESKLVSQSIFSLTINGPRPYGDLAEPPVPFKLRD